MTSCRIRAPSKPVRCAQHDELLGTRKQVQEAETKIKQLELELNHVSELVREDALTGALNRRGLDATFKIEATQQAQQGSVGLLDIKQDFKHLNDILGHSAGDDALIHLINVIKDCAQRIQ